MLACRQLATGRANTPLGSRSTPVPTGMPAEPPLLPSNPRSRPLDAPALDGRLRRHRENRAAIDELKGCLSSPDEPLILDPLLRGLAATGQLDEADRIITDCAARHALAPWMIERLRADTRLDTDDAAAVRDAAARLTTLTADESLPLVHRAETFHNLGTAHDTPRRAGPRHRRLRARSRSQPIPRCRPRGPGGPVRWSVSALGPGCVETALFVPPALAVGAGSRRLGRPAAPRPAAPPSPPSPSADAPPFASAPPASAAPSAPPRASAMPAAPRRIPALRPRHRASVAAIRRLRPPSALRGRPPLSAVALRCPRPPSAVRGRPPLSAAAVDGQRFPSAVSARNPRTATEISRTAAVSPADSG